MCGQSSIARFRAQAFLARNTRARILVLGDAGAIGLAEVLEAFRSVAGDPACGLIGRCFQPDRNAVFLLEAGHQHIELERSDRAQNGPGARARVGTPARRPLRPCRPAPRLSCLAFIASSGTTRRSTSGAKFGIPSNLRASPSVSVSPTRRVAVIGDADDVAREGLVDRSHAAGRRKRSARSPSWRGPRAN